MRPAQSNPPRIPFLAWSAATILMAAWLRLRNIDVPEPFVDEGANILTALDPRVRIAFEPLAQGRPGLIWLFKPAGWWPEHALIVARMMSAGAGLAAALAIGWILHQLAGRVAALCGMLLWAAMPLAVFHERLALQDSFVTALLAGVVGLFTAGSLSSRLRFNWVWFASAGIAFGIAFILKISAALALPWLAILYFAVRQHASRRWIDRDLLYVALGAMAPLALLGPDVLALGSKLSRYGAVPLAGNTESVPNLLERAQIWLGYYSGYGGWPLLMLGLSAIIFVCIGRSKKNLPLACASGWLVATVVTAVFYNNTYARYTLPDHVPLILFLALAVGWAWTETGKPRYWVPALMIAALAGWSRSSWQINTDATAASIPSTEIAQYFTGPWSGRGVTGIKRFLTRYADTHRVRCMVLTHQFLRPGCYGLMLAELGDPRIGAQPFTIYEPSELAALESAMRKTAASKPVTFFLLYEGSIYPAHPWLNNPTSPARLVHEEPRGDGENFTLYRIEQR